jgi:hypothetical protein
MGINFDEQPPQLLGKNVATRGNTIKREMAGMLVLFTSMRAKAKPDGPISITRYAKVEATAVPPVGLRPFKINDFSVRANCAQ